MVAIVFPVLFLVLGAVAGSFAGVVAERAYTGQSWKKGRSRCNACARELTPFDLVPVLSWAASRGRCRSCEARIPADYFFVELALGVVFLAGYEFIGFKFSLLPFLVALVLLAAIVLYDLRHMIVPPAFAAWFAVASFVYAFLAFGNPGTFALVCALAGAIGLFFLLFYLLSSGRLMGLGDTPVAFGLSFLAGTSAITGLVFSFWIGAAIGIIILFKRAPGSRMRVEVPFVPFMAAGFLLATFLPWNPFSLAGF